jgi:hypothetical protein
MRKSRITIETVHCKRCGRELATTSRSIHGLDNLKAQYGYLCHDCTTESERQAMIEAIGHGMSISWYNYLKPE